MTTLAAFLPGLKAIRVFTSSGTWVKPADLRFALVEVIGGGGGGANTSAIGGTGGSSSFSTVSATGGVGGGFTTVTGAFAAGGAPGLGSGGDLNYYGNYGGFGRITSATDSKQPGWCSSTRYNPYGRGGQGASVANATARAAGGSGGYARKMFDATALADSVTVTVGAAGTGVAGVVTAGSGLVVVYEYA